jgi:hypothetical protein
VRIGERRQHGQQLISTMIWFFRFHLSTIYYR